MQPLHRRFFIFVCAFLALISSFSIGYAQTTQIPPELLPAGINVNQLSNAQMSSLLNNSGRQNTGKDKNAGLEAKSTYNKDTSLPIRVQKIIPQSIKTLELGPVIKNLLPVTVSVAPKKVILTSLIMKLYRQ